MGGEITRVVLGEPTDQTLQDGYITTWTPDTRTVDAIDQLNQALGLLVKFGGLAGPPGLDGIDGEDGPPGPPGSTGAAGASGIAGPPGLDGLDGEDGQQGVPGPQGLQGLIGPQGPPGADGEDGVEGPQGPPGPAGATGATGVAGPPGLDGIDGEPGLDGVSGVSAHHQLTGLTAYDDHTQYALLAGRAGGQTLQGGTAASEALTLISTSNATLGKVTVEQTDFTVVATLKAMTWVGGVNPSQISYDSGTNTYKTTILGVDGVVADPTKLRINVIPVQIENRLTLSDADRTITTSADSILLTYTGHTYTLNGFWGPLNNGCSIQALWFNPTIVNQTVGNGFGMGTLFNSNPTLKNPAAAANNFGPVFSFVHQPTYQADTKAITLPLDIGFVAAPLYRVINGGTLAATTIEGMRLQYDIGAGVTVTTRKGLHVLEGTQSGTLTNQYGIDIDALTLAGTLNVGIRNASTLRQVAAATFGADAAVSGASVGLEIQSTTKVLLLSRMTTVQKNALGPINGMVVYDSTLNKFQGYENGAWANFSLL